MLGTYARVDALTTVLTSAKMVCHGSTDAVSWQAPGSSPRACWSRWGVRPTPAEQRPDDQPSGSGRQRRRHRARTSTPTASPTATAAGSRVDPVSLPALMAKHYDGRGPAARPCARPQRGLRPRFVTYRSGTCASRASSTCLADPARSPCWSSATGTSTRRSTSTARDCCASRTIWRATATPSCTPTTAVTPRPTTTLVPRISLRLGYTEDVINAVLADPAFGPAARSTASGSGCSVGRWAAASCSTC